MYNNIFEKFLQSKSLKVRMAAIKCFMKLVKEDFEAEYTSKDAKLVNLSRSNLYNKFYELISVDFEGRKIQKNDKDINTISFLLQLHAAVFCASFNNRMNHLFELSKIFMRFDLPESLGIKLFDNILNNCDCANVYSIVDYNDIIRLIGMWISRDWEIPKFPWYFTEFTSFDNFISENYNLIIMALLKTKYNLVDEFINKAQLQPEQALLPVMNRCFAYMIPYNAKCNISYENSAKELKKKVSSVISSDQQQKYFMEHIAEITILITENVIDNENFSEICGFDPGFKKNEESIGTADFEKCLQHMKLMCDKSQKDDFMTFLCKRKQNCVEQIFLLHKKKIQMMELKEKKLMYIFQYYILVENTIVYMNDPSVADSESIKDYLSREITSYFCYMITNDENGQRLRNISAMFLLNYLQAILPACIEQIKQLLDRIIPQLVSICTKSERDPELYKKCFNIIKFLILEQVNMDDEIAKLDRFPSAADFNELRQKQIEIKYAKREFSLVDEIEHFLGDKKTNRKIEGLIELREHLTNRKNELKQLFDQVESFGHQKDESLLHKLLRSLISYSNSNIDENRAIEAIKCLGEIGSHDIATIVFNVEDQKEQMIYQKIENVQHCQRLICNRALEKIEIILLHHNMVIFQSASEACYHLLKSASCVDFDLTLCRYLRPFIPETANTANLFYLEPKNDKSLEIYSLLADEYVNHNAFVKKMVKAMMFFAGDKSTLTIIAVYYSSFAELLFLMIFQLLIQYNNELVNEEILKTLNYFFQQSYERLNYSERTYEGSIFIEKKVIRQMLKLVEIVRVHCQDHQKSKLAKTQNLNYLHIARAAKHCEAYFSTIQYCEMWARQSLEADNIEFTTSIKNSVLQDIMYESYMAIGITDPINLFINKITNRSLYLQDNGMFIQSFLEAPLEKSSTSEYMKLFANAGLYNIANKFDESLKTLDESQRYECLWRLSKWDEICDTDTQSKDDKGFVDYESEYEKYHYVSLKCCKNDDELGMKNSVLMARKAIVQQISHQSLECSKTLYKFLEMSHRLTQIDDYNEASLLFQRINFIY